MAAKDAGSVSRSRVGSLFGAVTRAAGLGRGGNDGPSTEEAPQRPAADATTAPAKAPAKKASKKTASKKAAAKKSAAKKATAKKAAAPKTAGKKAAASTAKKAAAKKSAAKKKTVKPELAVREDEDPWSAAELVELRGELTGEAERLEGELRAMESDVAGLIGDSGSGAGDDQADISSKAFERDHEYSLAQSNRTALEQTRRALQRIDEGTYGVCENCGQPIGKLRLQAFPRATLCMPCKKQERR